MISKGDKCNMIFTFVILHYKTKNDTVDCIESILNLNKYNKCIINIVVVDNASRNGSLEFLKEKYKLVNNIYFIENNENLGFAKGNNIGYKFAKEDLNSDFIVSLNNDIIIESKNIIQLMEQLYFEEKFYIMGPDIVSMVDNGHQNPVCKTSSNIIVISIEIVKYKILLFINRTGIYDLLQSLFSSGKKSNSIKLKEEKKVYGCQLHGSFIVFSPNYVKREKYAFFPKTFLYCEEAILFQHCNRKSYKIMYDPGLVVLHKEDSSTSFINSTSKEKREFVFSNIIKSHKVFINYLINPYMWK